MEWQLGKFDAEGFAPPKGASLLAAVFSLVVMLTGGSTHAEEPRSHDDLYREGVALVDPYIRLHDRAPQPIDAAKLAQGLVLLERVVSINPQNWPAYWMLGMGYRAQKDELRSYLAFQRAYQLKRSQPDVAREFAATCLRLGKGDEAVLLARRAMENKPDDAGLQANLALALIIAGKLDEAAKEARAALSRAPSDPITQALVRTIDEIRAGKRPRPRTLIDLEK